MKEIKLTQGYVTKVDEVDYPALSKFKWYTYKTKREVYAVRNLACNEFGYRKGFRTKIRMHRQILGLSCALPDVDHWDGDGLNNQRDNLRLCTRQQNLQNRRSAIGSASKYTGIEHKQNGQWRARILIDDVRKSLGCYSTELEAALVRDRYIIDNNLNFFRLNILAHP
jgi:hypothetical protein